MIKLPRKLLVLFVSFAGFDCYSQLTQKDNPTMTGYFSAVLPIVSYSKDGSNPNFSSSFTIGFPTGLNLWKNERTCFTFELTPFVRAQDGDSKVSNVLFHPGILHKTKLGFSITGRLAFETSGRYGFTFVMGKTLVKGNNVSWFVAVPFPVRFGNAQSTSVGISFQTGIIF